ATVPPELPHEALQTLRQAMSRDAGVVRDGAGLLRLLARIDALARAHGPALPLVAARLLARCALDRTESRGAHFRSDCPDLAPARRTLTTLAELGPRTSLREAAE
ncbi:MAG: nadB, partial [Caulobacteraceae bacterium]|nr:nadB [Caulobacteraceae bacterium]